MRGWAALVAVLVAVQWQSPVAAQTELIPGYPDHPVRGPAAARGALLYSHGLARSGETASDAPYLADYFWDSGWDVFRLQRRRAGEDAVASTEAVVDTVRRLREQGYGKVVLLGHSFGAWISLAASQQAAIPIDAVIALTPAAYGVRGEDPDWRRNADLLYPVAETAATPRLLVFLFDDDPYEPPGRGDRLRDIFASRNIAAAVVDRPQGFAGHDAGLSRGFAERFGACVRDFIESTTAAFFVCPPPPPTPRAGAFPLPDGLQFRPPPVDADAGLAGMLGSWYGAYPQGREILFVVPEVARDRALAVYAFGPIARGGDEHAGYTRRRGEYDAATGIVRFSEPQADQIIESRLRDDGALDLASMSRSTGERLQTVLRRVAAPTTMASP